MEFYSPGPGTWALEQVKCSLTFIPILVFDSGLIMFIQFFFRPFSLMEKKEI